MNEKQKPHQQQSTQVQGNINLNMDTTPAIYTDIAFWNLNSEGVILNFGQAIMGTNQIKIYTRLGMSIDFIKKFLKGLWKYLALTEAQGQTGNARS